MHKFHVTIHCTDGTIIEWDALYPHSVDATLDAYTRVGVVAKVKVVALGA